MDQLIKIDKNALEPISNILIVLFNKLDKIAGWVAMPKGKRADQEEAIRFYIKELEKNENMPILMKAALITQARKTLKEYCNINDIVQIAIEQMDKNANPEELNDDWFSYFYDHAKNINQDNTKILWGKILASECNNANSVPKALIHTLSIMSKNNAEAFEKLCGFIVEVIKDGDVIDEFLLIVTMPHGLHDEYGLDYNILRNLETLGLIIYSKKLVVHRDIGFEINELKYHDIKIRVDRHGKTFLLGDFMLTEVGEALSKIIKRKKIDGFTDYLKKYYESNGFTIIF